MFAFPLPEEENAQLLSSSPFMPSDNSPHFTLQHEIFVLDAYLNKPLDESKAETITRNLIDALLRSLRMEELGPLQIYRATDLRAPGWSFIQPITTSHISGHYFEKPGKYPHIRMDFYSCASVNWRKVIAVIHEHLNMGEWKGSFIDRQIDEGQRFACHVSGIGGMILDEMDLLDHKNHLVAKSIAQKKMKEAIKV